jgi:hypothetical protein
LKKTDLEKLKGLKIANEMRLRRHDSAPGASERRERRRRDQALGLVPFAIKVESALVARLRERAAAEGRDLNELVGELLRRALGEDGSGTPSGAG